nr:unnamed protein product [Digitaria exilis]
MGTSKMASARLALAAVGISCVVLLSSFGTAAATGKTGRITVYWGQTSSEGSLHKACQSNLYSAVILSFLTKFGHGSYKLDLTGHSWSAVGPDIKYCQSKNILVLLAIGGGFGDYSLASKADAKAVADHIWDVYLGGHSKSRPFGDAALETGLFDRVHVQFYNNPVCSYRSSNVEAFTKAWQRWTRSFPRSSVYLGLPASPRAAGSGYVEPATLVSKVLPIVRRSKNYGGIMLWSRYWDLQTGYSRAVKHAV